MKRNSTIKWIMRAVLCLTLCMSMLPTMSIPTAAEGTTKGTLENGLSWNLTDGTLTISGTGAMPNLPSSTSAPWYEDNTSIQNIVIESGVTSIGDHAFCGCIWLTSVMIPDSVTSIGDHAFDGCVRLTSVTIPNSVTSIGEGAFENCISLMSVEIPNSVTSFGNYAFSDCKGLTSVEIPDSVTSIGNHAFDGCVRLTSVTIPDSVTSIGNNAFSGCSSLTSVTIPNSVTSIGFYAFHNCSRLTSVTIPNSVTSIGHHVFYGCSGLTSVTIPNSVTSIGEGAFENCISLMSVEIPNSVTSISFRMFNGCSSLTSVTIPDSVTSIDNSAFNGCSSLTSVTIPDSVTSIGVWMFRGCSSLTSVTIPDSVTSIGEEAFENCSSLTSVTIPDSVTSIDNGAFNGCSKLASVTIGNSVTSIGEGAFENCSSLTSVTAPCKCTVDGQSLYVGETLLYSFGNSVTVTAEHKANDTGNCVCGYNPIESVAVTGDKTSWVYAPDATATLTAAVSLVEGYTATTTTYAWTDDSTDQTCTLTGLNAGDHSYTCTVTVDGYKKTSEAFAVSVGKAASSVTAAPTPVEGLTYSGSAQALITAGSTQHGTMQYSLDNASWSAEIPTATNAREYTVYYKVVGDENHNDTDPASVTVTIGQMDLSGAAVTLGTALTYNGTAQTQSIASVTLNGLTLTAGDYTVTGNQQTGAGDYTLTITGKGNFTGTATAAWSIAKASMTITADNVTVLVGKDVPAEAALTYTVTGLVNGETADDALTKKPALSYAETPDTTQEGSYTINISGAEAVNYTITYVTGTLTVSEKTAVTITVNLPANLVYDGTDQSDRIKANITAVDTATGEAVTVAGYEYQFSADPINAGSYTLTVSVADSDEQYVGSVNVSFTIAKRSLTLKADNKSAYVNDSEPEYTFTVTGLVAGHSASGAVADCADADMTKAGTYDITISTATLVIMNGETDVTANYAITAENGTLTVSTPYVPPYIPPVIPTPEPEKPVTIPVTDKETSVEIEVTISEGKATVENVDPDELEKVVNGESTKVSIDFSVLDEPIAQVELPSEAVEKIAAASDDSERTLEIVLTGGLIIEFNASSLNEQIQKTEGTNLSVSVLPGKDAELTKEQTTAVGDRPAYDINVISNGKHISNMGGKITVTVPYELRNGEKGSGLVVYYVNDHGKRERCETRYDEQTKLVSWETDHLSLYMIDYDETLAEVCDRGENCPLNDFTDTDPSEWYHNGIHYCVENDLIIGLTDDLFGIDSTATRAQIVTILWRLEGKPVVNYLMQFEDVASESWYTEAVRWAASKNIVGGYGNGKFGPNDPITRQQMAAILYRYSQYKGIDVSVGEDTNILSYTDAFSISEWAIPAMQWACGSGMIQGVADGDGMKLDPSGSATRAQIATILWRFCDTIMDN